MRDRPYPGEQNMWDRGLQGVGGMWSGLGQARQGLSPYSNRLTLAGLGLLSGKDPREGFAYAARGLIAGSALDTQRKRERGLEALMKDPNSALGSLSESDKAYLASNPDAADQVMAARMKPADYGDKYQGYQLAKQEGYTGSWMDYQKEFKGDGGVTINTGGNLPTGYRFIDPTNPSAGAERIEGVHGSEAEQKSEALLTMVEPDYQTALSTFGSLSNPADLAASYGGDIGRYFQSADYQVATDAITNIAQSYLYSASGQAAPDAEVRRMARLVTPTLTDKPEAIAMKKKRLGSMVEAIRQKTGTPALVSPEDGWTTLPDGRRIREMP